MATLLERAIGAARLDPATYEDVEADTGALTQAMTVVVVAAVASGLGSGAASGGRGFGLVGGVISALIAWFVWALLTWLIGTKLLPEPETKSDLGELLRTIGFAAAPGVAGILGFIPAVGGVILFAVSLWQLAAMVIAVRQALDYKSTGRAILVCAIGFLIQLVVVVALGGLLIGGIMAMLPPGTQPPALTP